MNAIAQTMTLPFGTETAHRLVSFFGNLREEIAAWRRARATVTALRRLSPQQLEDIGLTIADVEIMAARGRI